MSDKCDANRFPLFIFLSCTGLSDPYVTFNQQVPPPHVGQPPPEDIKGQWPTSKFANNNQGKNTMYTRKGEEVGVCQVGEGIGGGRGT